MRAMRMRMVSAVLVVGLALGAGAAWAAAPKSGASKPGKGAKGGSYASQDLVDAATAAGFTKFVELVKTAGLSDTLKGEKPHTVFIPTNEAIAAVPAATLDALVKEPEKLKAVLLNHVVAGDRELKKMVKATGARTEGGADILLKTEGKAVLANGARVVKTESICKNGRFCGVDKVMLPAPTATRDAKMP